MKKFALVLSGGGFKGAFQIGALRYLKDNWAKINPGQPEMKFDIIAGISVGSLNGALLASGKFEELEKLWKDVGENGVEEIYTSDFIDTQSQSETLQLNITAESLIKRFAPGLNIRISFWKGLQLLFSQSRRDRFLAEILLSTERDFTENFQQFKALADNTPLQNKLKDLIRIKDIQDVVYRCGFVSLDNGIYYSLGNRDFASDEDFQKGIMASTSMPIIWEPVPELKTTFSSVKNLVDGGIKNVSPLGDVIDEINRDSSDDEYTIFIINCNTHDIEEVAYDERNIAQIALRSLTDIALSEIFNNDLEEFLRINDILEQIGEIRPGFPIYNYDFRKRQRTDEILKTFKTVVIQPDLGILGDSLVSTKALYNRRYAHGREKAMMAVEDIHQKHSLSNTIIV
ncbi:patatin-like phospholipase family protein [Negadavirga shengliensis]|uniref:Patatin-like phospholipase family protein n=1 Tax=Negadavirga shengliensis TaxID=1389218 RepID=A0ABV9T245_9BACT